MSRPSTRRVEVPIDELIAELVRSSTAESGVPERLEDRTTAAKVAEILMSSSPVALPRRAGPGGPAP